MAQVLLSNNFNNDIHIHIIYFILSFKLIQINTFVYHLYHLYCSFNFS